MAEEFIEEIFRYPTEEFKEHLENESNERILFSGRYGMGKTTFLTHVFDKDIQPILFKTGAYNVFRLFPVNYSISSNEDILRYIKYDIIIQLLVKQVEFPETSLSYLKTLPVFLKSNLHTVLYTIIKMIPKVGREVTDAYDGLEKLGKKFESLQKGAEEKSGDKLAAYLGELEIEQGSIFENDVITRIITDTIKSTTTGKSVLLVDDVDRLDPEHLFRILNVFAAHFDSPGIPGTKNKFAFDKVIIVCDFQNIRNLFHYRYGDEADFMVYIDKFYSSDVYHFDNRKAVREIISSLFESITFSSDSVKELIISREIYFGSGFLLRFLEFMIERKLINLRSLLKLRGRVVKFHREKIVFEPGTSEPWAAQVSFAPQLRLLTLILGDSDRLERILEVCRVKAESIENHDSFFGMLMYVLNYERHSFSRRTDKFQFHYRETEYQLTSKRDFETPLASDVRIDLVSEDGNTHDFFPTPAHFWTAMSDVLALLKMKNFIL